MAIHPAPCEKVLDRPDEVDYDPLLLEDHPLRGYPRELPPGLDLFVQNWYHTIRKNWRERLFRAVCLLLIFLVIIQTLAIIPHGISYLFPSEQESPAKETWGGSEFHHRDCLPDNTRPHSTAQIVSTTGCIGARADVWLYNNRILVGRSIRDLDEEVTFQNAYLDPLLRRFETQTRVRSNEGGGSGAEESFVLFLELKTSLHALWPRLVGELEALRSAGYLSHLEGPRIVLGRLTVVVTMGDADMLETHGVDNAYNDVFFDTSLDELMLKDYESVSRMGGKIDSAGLRRVYSATTNFRDSVGIPRHGGFSRQQIEVIRAQARAANQRGLRVRYEEIPRRWRIREMVREILRQERAELIEEETV